MFCTGICLVRSDGAGASRCGARATQYLVRFGCGYRSRHLVAAAARPADGRQPPPAGLSIAPITAHHEGRTASSKVCRELQSRDAGPSPKCWPQVLLRPAAPGACEALQPDVASQIGTASPRPLRLKACGRGAPGRLPPKPIVRYHPIHQRQPLAPFAQSRLSLLPPVITSFIFSGFDATLVSSHAGPRRTYSFAKDMTPGEARRRPARR